MFSDNVEIPRDPLKEALEKFFNLSDLATNGAKVGYTKKVWVADSITLSSVRDFKREALVADAHNLVILVMKKSFKVDTFSAALRALNGNVSVYPIVLGEKPLCETLAMYDKLFADTAKMLVPGGDGHLLSLYLKSLTNLDFELKKKLKSYDDCYKNLTRVCLCYHFGRSFGFETTSYQERTFITLIARNAIQQAEIFLRDHTTGNISFMCNVKTVYECVSRLIFDEIDKLMSRSNEFQRKYYAQYFGRQTVHNYLMDYPDSLDSSMFDSDFHISRSEARRSSAAFDEAKMQMHKSLAEALRTGSDIDFSAFASEFERGLEDRNETPESAEQNESIIEVPSAKLAGGELIPCPTCGAEIGAYSSFCPECGAPTKKSDGVKVSEVQFSAISPKKLEKGDYSIIDVYMYEDQFDYIVNVALNEADQPSKATTSGFVEAELRSRVKVVLTSPDIDIDDNVSECVWNGRYQKFSFDIYLPEDYSKKKILFKASVYINGVIATNLKFLADCESAEPMRVEKFDITRAFVSYASQDRSTVTMIVQGLRKARPDMQIFFDVETLRSGERWEDELRRNIDMSDVLFLCWSHFAKASRWVDYEWRYALDNKGVDFIEPIPLEPPANCQPPEELSSKHFNDLMLYIRKE